MSIDNGTIKKSLAVGGERKTHDTIDGLLAEFRGYSAGMPPSYHVTMSWHDFRRMLDRFEAAHKREVEDAERRGHHAATKACCETIEKAGPFYDAESVGNAAKLRAALKLALSLLDLEEGVPYKTISQKDLDFMKSALAAPARNCDVGTAAEQTRRFCRLCDEYLLDRDEGEECLGCPLVNMVGHCELYWAQMPYAESEAANMRGGRA